MPSPIDPLMVQAVLRDLGVEPTELEALRRCPLAEGQRKLAELKERVHKNYRRAAFELHPDRTGNDSVKTERFKLLATIRDDFEKLQLAPAQPRYVPMPVPQVIRIVSWASASSAFRNASTATTTVVINAPFVFTHMRPS
jgi:hypothetical protein